ncbi:hypothetical protein DFH09DRAFT_1170103, partial [Mycena vulgaris]
ARPSSCPPTPRFPSSLPSHRHLASASLPHLPSTPAPLLCVAPSLPPSLPSLIAPARGAFPLASCFHLHFHSRLLSSRSFVHAPIRCPSLCAPQPHSSPSPSHLEHAIPFPSPLTRARASSSVVHFVLPFLYISSINSLWSFPLFLVAPLPFARPPTRPSPRFHLF